VKIVVLDDGNRGNFVQACGIAKAISGAEMEIYEVKFRGPRYRLPGRKGEYSLAPKLVALFCLFRLWKQARKLLSKFLHTRLVLSLEEKKACFISAGSLLAPVNLALARSCQGCSVVVMTPSLLPLSLFDLAIIPYHDWLRIKPHGDNILVTLASPNDVNPESLKEAGNVFRQIVKLPADAEVIGILIGGNDQNYQVTTGWIERLLSALKKYASNHKSCFLFTTSRRTPAKVVKYLKQQLETFDNVAYAEYPGFEAGRSLYRGILSCSETLIVSEDSVNMISESISSGHKVIIAGVPRKKKKLIFDRTIKKICEGRYALYVCESELENLGCFLERARNILFRRLSEAEKCAQKILQTCQLKGFC